MTHFVITYDHTSESSEVLAFDDDAQAFAEFASRERAKFGDAQYEVVMVSAASIEEVRATHPNFFIAGDLLPDSLPR